jgi:hypothetical protein
MHHPGLQGYQATFMILAPRVLLSLLVLVPNTIKASQNASDSDEKESATLPLAVTSGKFFDSTNEDIQLLLKRPAKWCHDCVVEKKATLQESEGNHISTIGAQSDEIVVASSKCNDSGLQAHAYKAAKNGDISLEISL